MTVLVLFVPKDTGTGKHFLNKTLVALEIAPPISTTNSQVELHEVKKSSVCKGNSRLKIEPTEWKKSGRGLIFRV